jgi:hypothetical protein
MKSPYTNQYSSFATDNKSIVILPVSQEKQSQNSEISTAIAKLDAWLDTMRVEDPKVGLRGYGGPVSHWWRSSLLYTGPGLDWRYEGIIAGYLTLWGKTGEQRWLDKAVRAGDDLVEGQLENGHFPASAFEANPAAGGTPHEAACDIALLLLAKELKEPNTERTEGSEVAGDSGAFSSIEANGSAPARENYDWQRYFEAAERNLQAYYLDKLWDHQVGYLRDHPRVASFVPNKAATASEAFFLMAEVSGKEQWIDKYALPTLGKILAHQIHDGSPLDGAIAQNSFGARIIEKYFPFYIARCLPALVKGYELTDRERYVEAALAAMNFIAHWTYPDGSLPQVVYPGGRVSRYPSWVAALGDILRIAVLLQPYNLNHDFGSIHQRLLLGQDESGGFQTATGFGLQANIFHTDDNLPYVPDIRDLLHVAGWADKAFRFLSIHAATSFPIEFKDIEFEADCERRGEQLHFRETQHLLEITSPGAIQYRWSKRKPWAEIAAVEYWLR